MKDTEFIEKIIELYKKAKEPTFKNGKGNIKRGRGHSISSKVEDLFAVYVSDKLSGKIELLIDQPFIYFKGKRKKKKTIYPDIALIKDDIILNLFDLKMDLGFHRKFYPFCKEKETLITNIRNSPVNMATKEESKEEKSDKKIYKISETIKYNIVIISNQNISKKQKQVNAKAIKNRLDKDKLEVFILTNIHPNKDYGESISKEELLRGMDFIKLGKEIKRNVK